MSFGDDTGEPREGSAPSLEAAVTEAMIRDLVHAFYARARADPVLGPIFDRAVRDWDAHLAKLCDFWSSIMLGTARFRGAPVAVHAQQPEIQIAQFARWLLLFSETAREVCPPRGAALFIARAEIVAESLQSGIVANRAVLKRSLPARPDAP